MITAWTKHLKTQEEKDQFLNTLYGNKMILHRLSELVQEMSIAVEESERSPKAYDTPSWSYLQAHKNGYLQAAASIQKLLTLDQRETK